MSAGSSPLPKPAPALSSAGESRSPVYSLRLALPAFLAFWAVFGILYMARDRYWADVLGREPERWSVLLQHGLFSSYLQALLAVLAFAIARRFPLEAGTWLRNLSLHLVLGAGAIGCTLLLSHALAPLVIESAPQELVRHAVAVLPAWSLLYVLMLGVGYGFEYMRRARERELRMAHLQSQLARAQLQALKMELHPHFLFNTLNSISALMHRNVEAAERMLRRLQDVFRLTLEKSAAHEVPLEEELKILEPYLEIEQTRFGDRLVVDWQVDEATLEAAVPQLILQPLVENAIKHGVAPRSSPGRIRISALRLGDDLQLVVEDNGTGFPAAVPVSRNGSGVGLMNTRLRLEKLYDGRHGLELTTGRLGGACVRIRIPFRPVQRETRGRPLRSDGRTRGT
jgi:two-component system, LytTR family, sensor kinase